MQRAKEPEIRSTTKNPQNKEEDWVGGGCLEGSNLLHFLCSQTEINTPHMDYAHQKPKYFPVILFQWKEKEKVAFNTSQQIHYISLSTEFHHISKQPHKKKHWKGSKNRKTWTV